MDNDEPVWITGVGAATPLGCELAEIEANLLAGRSGVSLVTRFPDGGLPEPDRRAARGDYAFDRVQLRDMRGAAPAGAARPFLVRRGGPARRRPVGMASRGAGRPGAGARGRVDVPLGGRSSPRRHPALRPGAGPRIDDRAGAPRAGDHRAGAGAFGRVRQRQPRARDRPPLAPARAGRRLRGGGLRPGRHADRPGDLRQPAGAVAAKRRPGRRVAPLRPRPRRVRAGRRGRGVRPGAGKATPVAARRTPTPRSPAAGPAATPTTT